MVLAPAAVRSPWRMLENSVMTMRGMLKPTWLKKSPSSAAIIAFRNTAGISS